MDRLSPRQIEVLHLVVAGLTNSEIGQRLGIGHSTVRRHLEVCQRRLRVAGRIQLAVAFTKLTIRKGSRH